MTLRLGLATSTRLNKHRVEFALLRWACLVFSGPRPTRKVSGGVAGWDREDPADQLLVALRLQAAAGGVFFRAA